MASLREHKKSPFLVVSLKLPRNKRTTASTKLRADAPTSEERKEKRNRALEVGNLLEGAGRKAEREGLTRDEAVELVNRILHAAGLPEIDKVTTRAFFSDWLKGKNNEGTNERYSHSAELFLNHLGPIADAGMGKVTYHHVLGFIKVRREAGAAPKTIRTDVKALNNAFNIARRLGNIPVNPVEQALALQPIAVTSCTKEVFAPPQIRKLVEAAVRDWKTCILLGYYTAGRLRDCANLKAKQIDWVQGMITVRQLKTGKPAWIPIHACLARHLKPIVEGLGPEDYVCPSLANRKTGGKTGLSREFAAVMRKAGIDQQIIPGKGKRRFSKLSFHSFRHSFNSHLANAGVDQETRQIMTGHETKAANDDYTHLDLPKLRSAVEKLPDLDLLTSDLPKAA